jgi:hypothetical protein
LNPAAGGAFAKIETREQMLCNIGGDDDTNPKITRRMLFLLEGEWLFNESGFKDVRRRMLDRYVPEHVGDHHLTLFLLNDIIRYYRTVAVDYEFKTAEGTKPWGIRNLKLIFSRKLLYCSGIFSVAKTLDNARNDKIRTLEDLFDIPVIDRMISICGRSQMQSVLTSYCRFLEKFEDADVRQRLVDLRRDERDDPLSREIKNEGHRFTRELMRFFEEVFDPTHPIRRAIIF